ncbi:MULTISPECIES: alanine/glycine:cation symporter family protein [Parachlamydia]|jgi:AGCS family alanine or glycine:cation symporter|uniref:alanine/glycine:cation symporter family protein n=1 Tax=Parachlamydia TaxID=83551 RepID=UPI0002FFF246|nr:amino acid carrier protein [Parachlamydia acanthamoebae]
MELTFKSLLIFVNETLTAFIIFPSIIVLGLYLTYQLKFVQISKLSTSFKQLLKKGESEKGNISHFEALSAVLAGNFGTGNISGMAVALSTGGPGALVWMWVMAFLGAAIQYASCLLAVKYREINASGEYVGGPMYYLKNGLGLKSLSFIFSIFTILGALTVGNFAQVNSISLPLAKMGIPPLFMGITMAFLVGIVIVGGIQRIAKLASIIVPFKAALYLGGALLILIMHYESIPAAFQLMFESAFAFKPAVGGILGYSVLKALTVGFERGLFATDAGTGIVPILQASARTSNPVIDGIATLAAPLLVMLVCTTTGLTLLVTGAWNQPDLQSTNMVTYAFQKGLGSDLGAYLVMVALALFGYTTILAWSCCAEKAIAFLCGDRSTLWFKYVYILLIPVGALAQVELVWMLADISISLMLITNLIGIAGLSSYVIEDSQKYFLTTRSA